MPIATSRYDKYDPKSGGFRARLAAAWNYVAPVGGVEQAGNSVAKVFAVGLDANGRVVKGAGNTGILGVCVVNRAMNAGEVVDVMTGGEIVEFTLHDGTSANAGTTYYGVPASGALSTTATGNVRLGATVEASRLVVRVGSIGAGA